MLHGVGLRAEAWSAQIEILSSEYAIVAPDLPGHGESAELENVKILAGLTDQIAKAIEAPSLIVGHSLGAMIALDLASRYADKVRAVVASNAIFQRDTTAKAAVEARAAALKNSCAPDPGATLQRWFGNRESVERQACHNWLKSVNGDGYRTAYSIFAQSNGPTAEALSKLECPSLFMTGAADPNSTPAMSLEMAALAPDSRALIVDGAAHMTPMTHADQVSTALLSFFEDVSR